ncbi:cobalt-precorrin-6A reductase [Phytoactinopolyspora alkaliphila]|uniref:Cobalt-precorrin-6A reductase n=1 Tax=Phytoactinopolyspora alkaliphila TaxID=1783498 RepID=A0A6N9YKM5_9ACTN|nr:cobalt-precorrin-6A reductase [Phytoactinopolyspora alkaliphila]
MLGGTAEARALASTLVGSGMSVVSSLAGRVSEPKLPAGEVRIGGFGGAAGLATWLESGRVAGVVDATHPFAERISASAVTAADAAGVPLLRLERPGWKEADGEAWTWAESLEDAARMVEGPGRRVFLTTGRQGLAAFARVTTSSFLIRCVDPPEPPLPPRAEVLLDRGPYTVGGELELMRAHRIDLLVTKDSGGTMTAAKLEAARRLGVPVIVVRRPSRPDAPTVETVDDAVRWVRSLRPAATELNEHDEQQETRTHAQP